MIGPVTQRQDVMGRSGRRVLDMRSRPPAPRGNFSGRVYVGSRTRIDVDRSEAGATQYLYVHFDGTCTWAASMPDQQPEDGQVYDLVQTFGDIHLPGNFA